MYWGGCGYVVNDRVKMKDTTSVRALERGLQILMCFQAAPSSLSHSEIVIKTGLSASTVSRLLSSLVACGFLQKKQDRRYSLGDQLIKLAESNKSSFDLRRVAYPFLESLRDIFDETASLYIVQNDMRVCLESVQSRQALRRTVEAGEVLPLSQGAVGYVLLAWQSYTKRQKVIAHIPHVSEIDLSKIRQDGYMINDGVHEAGVFAIAAPLFNSHGQCVAAIALSGPSTRLERAELAELINAIKSSANSISQMLGLKI